MPSTASCVCARRAAQTRTSSVDVAWELRPGAARGTIGRRLRPPWRLDSPAPGRRAAAGEEGAAVVHPTGVCGPCGAGAGPGHARPRATPAVGRTKGRQFPQAPTAVFVLQGGRSSSDDMCPEAKNQRTAATAAAAAAAAATAPAAGARLHATAAAAAAAIEQYATTATAASNAGASRSSGVASAGLPPSGVAV